jgi:hypothetical protein
MAVQPSIPERCSTREGAAVPAGSPCNARETMDGDDGGGSLLDRLPVHSVSDCCAKLPEWRPQSPVEPSSGSCSWPPCPASPPKPPAAWLE